MYSYYALRAVRVRVPKPVAMSITLLQITQVFIFPVNSVKCPSSIKSINSSLIFVDVRWGRDHRNCVPASGQRLSGGKASDLSGPCYVRYVRYIMKSDYLNGI